MREKRETRPPDDKREGSEEVDVSKLGFEQLKEAGELAEKSFQRTDNGFMKAKGFDITIGEHRGVYKVSPGSDERFDTWALNHRDSIVYTGSPDKEAKMDAVQEVLKELGYRIVE
jgi:hypothetical protein